jgi:hypothetical protein
MDAKDYPPDWPEISRRIRFERAQNRCEWCAAVNGEPHPVTGSKVVLTVAHLGTPHADGTLGDKHDKHDVRDENLAALCQRCHLAYDLPDHVRHRKYGRGVGQLSLLDRLRGRG